MMIDHKLKVVFHWLPGQQFYFFYWWAQLFVDHRDQIEFRSERSVFMTPLEQLYPLPKTLSDEIRQTYSHVLIFRDPYERLRDVFSEMMDHPDGARFINTRKIDSFEELADYLSDHPEDIDRYQLPFLRPQIEWAKQLKGCTVYALEFADLHYALPDVMLRLGYYNLPESPWKEKTKLNNAKKLVQTIFQEDLALFGLETETVTRTKKEIKPSKDELPFVSVVTPSYKRKHWLPVLERCLLAQTYPKDRFEWLILDDSPEESGDFIPCSDLNIRYIRQYEHMVLGEKRNRCVELAAGSIIIPCDDDDYIMPSRISHAVDVLTEHSEAILAYVPKEPMYDLVLNRLILVPFASPQYSFGNAWAYRRILLEDRKYKSNAYGEECAVVDRHLPTAELDPWKTLISFTHPKNTASRDKSFQGEIEVDRPIEELVPSDLLATYLSIYRVT